MIYWLTKLLTGILFKGLLDVGVEGVEHLPHAGPAIVIGNHACAIDQFVLIYALGRRASWYIMAAHFKRRFWGWYFRQLGGRPVESGADNREAKDYGRRALRAGQVMAIFPEGKVSCGCYLHPFRGGFLKLAVTERVPVVPAIIVGSEHAIRNPWNPERVTDFAPSRVKIRVRFLAPLWLENPTLDRALFAAQLANVERLMATEADELRRQLGLPCRDPLPPG